MQIEVTIPSLLRDCAGGRTRFEISCEREATLSGALRRLREAFPLLRVHVWDDQGRIRPHVLIFHNEQGIRWMSSLDVPLHEGDRIQVVQAISGG